MNVQTCPQGLASLAQNWCTSQKQIEERRLIDFLACPLEREQHPLEATPRPPWRTVPLLTGKP
jgi:hypothetical protein